MVGASPARNIPPLPPRPLAPPQPPNPLAYLGVRVAGVRHQGGSLGDPSESPDNGPAAERQQLPKAGPWRIEVPTPSSHPCPPGPSRGRSCLHRHPLTRPKGVVPGLRRRGCSKHFETTADPARRHPNLHPGHPRGTRGKAAHFGEGCGQCPPPPPPRGGGGERTDMQLGELCSL